MTDGPGGGPAGAGHRAGSSVRSRFLDALASARPTPGGGAAAAWPRAAGAALLGHGGAAHHADGRATRACADRMGEVAALADTERRRPARALADRDTAAFDAVMAAHRCPGAATRSGRPATAAVQAALARAAEVPLEVARRAARSCPSRVELVETGNANAVSDAYSAGHLLHTAVAAAWPTSASISPR